MTAITDYFGKSSIPTAYAVATTVKTTRNAGVSVLEAFDMSKYAQDTPIYFVTYKKTTDPVTGVASVTNLVSWKGLVNVTANTITNLTLAPGYADGGNAVGDFIECIPTSYWENSLMDGIFVGHNPDGTFKKSAIQAALGNDGNLVDSIHDLTNDAVISGGVWTTVSGINGTMTALTAYINGYKNTVATITSRSFTVSKDTYIDVLKDPTTNAFSLVYTEVANNAVAPVLAANSMRLAAIITSGTAIASVVQYGTDSLSNLYSPGINQRRTEVRDDNGVFTTQKNTITVSGWGSITCGGTTTTLTKTVQLPVRFKTVPIITVNPGGDQPGGAIALGNGGNSVQGSIVGKHYGDTVNSFNAYLLSTGSWVAGNVAYFTYTATGQVN